MAISQIKTSAIFDDSLTGADIGTGAISADELANLAVDTSAIQANAVTSAKVDATVATRAKAIIMPMIFGTYQ